MDKVQEPKGREKEIKNKRSKGERRKLKSKEREGKMQLRHASSNSSRNIETSAWGRRLKRESDVGDLA
jgi:hypothetical protein